MFKGTFGNKIPSFFLYDAILCVDFSLRGFSAFHVGKTCGFTYTTSNDPKFFTNFSQSVLNQAIQFGPLAVCGLLAMMDGSDPANRIHKN